MEVRVTFYETNITLLVAVSVIAFHDSEQSAGFGSEQSEGNEPEDDGEDVDTKDGPVVVKCRHD